MPNEDNTIICCTLVKQKNYSIKEWFDAVFALDGFEGEIYVLGNRHGSIYEDGNDFQIIHDQNKLREHCLQEKANMWILDSDTIPPKHAYKSLISVDADIVSALVPHTLGYNTYIYDKVNPDFTTMPLRCAKDEANTGIKPRDAVGSACMLIRFPCLQKIHFKNTYKSYSVSKSHELLYCLEARALGYSIKVNTNIVCNHLNNKSQ